MNLFDQCDLNELNELFKGFKRIKNEKGYFTYKDIIVCNDLTSVNGKILPTEIASLELERIRKNIILKNSIGQTIKVKGLISNVKMYRNGALFCLSPCIIDGVDVGHTWTRYDPAFKKIKHNSTISFYSEIKKYGDDKSGVNWEELSNIRISGGDNSPLYKIPVVIRPERDKSSYHREIGLRELTLIYKPKNIGLRYLKFQDYRGIEIRYDTFRSKLYLGDFPVIIDDQSKIDHLLLFEWLTKISDWEFWGWVNRSP